MLYSLTLARKQGASHKERLENFYSRQAAHYDGFRERLLKGRQKLISSLPWESLPKDGVWLDLGAGTGKNIEYARNQVSRFDSIYLVDLAPSLLAIAQNRIEQRGWKNVYLLEEDVTKLTPPSQPIHLITLSYSLTMIPDWFIVIENMKKWLAPGGIIAVCDFYVSRKHDEFHSRPHSWLTRSFWPTWFGFDNVWLSPDHVPFLHRTFDVQRFEPNRARLPYLPFGKAPYYLFIGKKRI